MNAELNVSRPLSSLILSRTLLQRSYQVDFKWVLNSSFPSPLNNKEVKIELSFDSMGLLVKSCLI